jgi:uncharacterized protein with gpF-like domain
VARLDSLPEGGAVSSARLPFEEQIGFFRGKVNVPTETWTDLWKAAHDKGFAVAGAQTAELLQDLKEAIDKAISRGTTLEEFRRDFDAIVRKHGWTGWTGSGSAAGRAWRTRVIYQTNLATSYAAGRLKQLRDPDMRRLKPYWMYKHNDSVLHPRPLHVAWSGLTLPAEHPWFATHYPPNGWGCQCRVVAVSRKEAERWGGRITDSPPDDGIDPATGAPRGIDRGWDYMPGASAAGEAGRIVATASARLAAPLAGALAQFVGRT